MKMSNESADLFAVKSSVVSKDACAANEKTITAKTPVQSLSPALLKVKPGKEQFEQFKIKLLGLVTQINSSPNESEEHHKNHISDFLKFAFPASFINTSERIDLVIHNGKLATDSVGVILEVKRPTNQAEMPTRDNLNVKAMQELMLYYLRERITAKNLAVKHLVITNGFEWFVFDAQLFEKSFAEDKVLVKQFVEFEAGYLPGIKTDFFYKQIAKPAIDKMGDVEFTHFDLREKNSDKQLIALLKLLSPEHLLKLPFINDSNSLNKDFYSELLHIIGLVEVKDGSKKLIQRKKEGERNRASLLENAISKMDALDKLRNFEKPTLYGDTTKEQLFNVGLELVITWINRVLFLKLLEAQLITYHKEDKSYAFLNIQRIRSFDDLDALFFEVLARKHAEREAEIQRAFAKVPYLNSSLFETTEIERKVLNIGNLSGEITLPIFGSTVLKDGKGKRRTGELNTLEYLFAFLDAYDFASEGTDELKDDNKALINASVLGLIFEKINGYKDGSFFTPGFITMYMCRETLRRAVVQKFNEVKGWACKDITELYNQIEDRAEANTIINSLKICDPAVGSGHFLVSALNELIAIKAELGVLQDAEGKRLKDYSIQIINDELLVMDEEGDEFSYNPSNPESARIQKTLFNEKQTLIENCLFGVDINPNSVKICRLRLWIELLKNAYYNADGQLETLPNIDINIKVGNSLISRFALDADLKDALKKSKLSLTDYRKAVDTYRNASSKEQKREMEQLIEKIKNDFRREILYHNPKAKKLIHLGAELKVLELPQTLLEESAKEKKERKQKQAKLKLQFDKLNAEIEAIKHNKIYESAFEWRFEFPEVLNDEGAFVGFDVVIGNPPYFSVTKIKEQAQYFSSAGYQTYSKGADIYCLFYERGNQLLRTKGLLTYITSNSWMRAIYGELLKTYFQQQMQPLSLLNVEDVQIFDEATVESNIITLQKGDGSQPFYICNLSKSYLLGSSLSDYFEQHRFEQVANTKDWVVSDVVTGQLKSKIEQQGKLLKEFNVAISFGIKTGYNEGFIVDEADKNKLVAEDSSSLAIIKPILRGRDLKKYSYDFSSQWAICTFPSLQLEIEKYPSVLEHFQKVGKTRLEQSGGKGSRKKTNNKWFETQDAISYWKEFERTKIVWGEISDKPKFAFDDSGYYAEATTFLMTGEKLKFLLGILNSKVSEWYFNQISTTTGMGTNRWKKYKIELLPIAKTSDDQELALEKLVDQILVLKKQNPSTDTSALESEIDQLVYALYDLTPEEIAIVEGKSEQGAEHA